MLGIGAYLLCFSGILVVTARMWRRPEYPNYAKNLCLLLLILAITIFMHVLNGSKTVSYTHLGTLSPRESCKNTIRRMTTIRCGKCVKAASVLPIIPERDGEWIKACA